MKTYRYKLLALGILALGFVTLAHAQVTNGVPVIGSPATPSGFNWSMLIPFGVPLIVAFLKTKVAPNLPTQWLPVIATVLGGLSDYLLQLAGAHTSGTLVALLLGAAGVGVREIVNQWFPPNGNNLRKASPLVIPACFLLVWGCANFSTNLFRLQQTAENTAFTAYIGWTNYLTSHPVSAEASNAVKQARLKFAATDRTLDGLRASYDTNSAVKPTIQAVVSTLGEQGSNVAWLVNFYQQ